MPERATSKSVGLILFVLMAMPMMANSLADSFLASPATPIAEHRFFDTTNKILFATHVGVAVLDFRITRKNLAGGSHETNPIAKPFIDEGLPGQVTFYGLHVGAGIGGAYLLHRMHHHKLERLWEGFMISDTARGVMVGYGVIKP